jgi:hypothetical protein
MIAELGLNLPWCSMSGCQESVDSYYGDSKEHAIDPEENLIRMRMDSWLRIENTGKNTAQNLRADVALDYMHFETPFGFPTFRKVMWESQTGEKEAVTDIAYLDERSISCFSKDLEMRSRKSEYYTLQLQIY